MLDETQYVKYIAIQNNKLYEVILYEAMETFHCYLFSAF